jgi:hypothetical protein
MREEAPGILHRWLLHCREFIEIGGHARLAARDRARHRGDV